MKSIAFFSRIAALGVVAATAGLVFNSLALALFAGTASAFVLLVAAGDYARRPNYLAVVTAVAVRRREAMPLAA
ncbi:MAG: hypothetical protein EXS37_12530 [Opitutus sp.]|nr:hypothetical protein [Opitutus sp.]